MTAIREVEPTRDNSLKVSVQKHQDGNLDVFGLPPKQARKLIEEARRIGIQVNDISDVARLLAQGVTTNVAGDSIRPSEDNNEALSATAPSTPKRGWARWEAARQAAGINPNDETANMFPSDAIAYRLLAEGKPVSDDSLINKLRPGKDPKKAKADVSQVLIRLRRTLPTSINKSVVNVGAPRHSEYLLVEVGKEQEAIEYYAKEREKLRLLEEERKRQEKYASRPEARLLGYLQEGVEIPEMAAPELTHAMFPDNKIDTARSKMSRLVRSVGEDLAEQGETILSVTVGYAHFYAHVKAEDMGRIRREIIARQSANPANRKPEGKQSSERPTREAALPLRLDSGVVLGPTVSGVRARQESAEEAAPDPRVILRESVVHTIPRPRRRFEYNHEPYVPEVTGPSTLTREQVFAVGVILRSPKMALVLSEAGSKIDEGAVESINKAINDSTEPEERKVFVARFSEELLDVGMAILTKFSEKPEDFIAQNPQAVRKMLGLVRRVDPEKMKKVVVQGATELKTPSKKAKTGGRWFHRSTVTDENDADFGSRLVVGNISES